jgi:hypothetical protein
VGPVEENRSHFPNGLGVPAPRKESCMELSGTKSDGLNEIPVAGSTTTSSVPTAASTSAERLGVGTREDFVVSRM